MEVNNMTNHEYCTEFEQAMNVILNSDGKLLASAKALIENEIENRLKAENIPKSCRRFHLQMMSK
jgi:hypothetical protein